MTENMSVYQGMIESLTFEQTFYEFKDSTLFDGTDIWLLGKTFHTTKGEGRSTYIKGKLIFETLLRRHLGLHWHWNRGPPEGDYQKILQMFADHKNALYSIHQIAQMSVSERKQMGEWIGPNTAAQVLKKLAIFDTWSDIAVHIALDNLLIAEDVRTMATTRPDRDSINIILEDGNLEETLTEPLQAAGQKEDTEEGEVHQPWRPLLIIIPLRLGLTTINEHYLEATQSYFRLPQCVGILGGRPNHALYFIGIKDNKDEFEMAEQLQKQLVVVDEMVPIDDDITFHCPFLGWMDYKDLDPSMALGFYCANEEDFDDLKKRLTETVLKSSTFPLFEQLETRPPKWPKFTPYVGVRTQIQMSEFLDMGSPSYESDDQFELLE